MAPKLMKCGHWSWSYVHSKASIIDAKTHEPIEFGPGCSDCYNGYPKQTTALEAREKFGDNEPLLDAVEHEPQRIDDIANEIASTKQFIAQLKQEIALLEAKNGVG